MTRKQLWLLVGGNGSGKSTFYRNWLAPLGLPFVNADIIAKEIFPESPEQHSYEAALIAEEMRMSLLQEGRSFCFETVFSHPTKIDFVAKAKALGYEVIMVFIHLGQIQLNKARVSQRVVSGGHNVPEDKIESRVPRVIENVKTAIPLCNQTRILDNSSYQDPYKPVAVIKEGHINEIMDPMPEWALYLLNYA